MATLEQQIADTWWINHRVNLKLMEALTDDTLALTTSTRGGGTVGHQLAHMYNVRFWKLEAFDKKLVEGLTTVKATDEKTLDGLEKLHKESAELIARVIENSLKNEGKVKGFKRGVVPMVGYFISHEGHHRGNILLTLKLCKYKLPREFKYVLWEWNKI